MAYAAREAKEGDYTMRQKEMRQVKKGEKAKQ